MKIPTPAPQLAAVLFGIIILAVAAGGCAAPTALPSGSSPTAAAPTSAPAATAPQPASNAAKELVIIQGTDPQTMDMQMITAQVVVNIGQHISETLLDYDENIKLKPLLAVEWKQIEPTVWQYKLREGVKFSNGEPFNAEQVKFSFDRVMAPESKSTRTGETRYVERVEVVDDYTVKFHTKGIVPLFDVYLSKFPIVPKGYITEKGGEVFAREPIGTGPYVLEEWVKDDHITLRRNPNYWGNPPKIETVIFRSVPDISARVATFLAGEADIVMDLQPATIQEVEQRDNLNVVKKPSMRTVFVAFNTLIESPAQNDLVRQAMNYAIDKEAIVNNVMDGYATPLQGQVVSPEYWGYDPDLKPYPYDPAKAKQLLAEAGFADGLDIRMSCPRGRYMNDAEICQALAGQLKEVGITLKVETREFGVHNEEFYTKKGGPMFLVGYLTEPDAARMLSIFQTPHPNSQRSNPEFDKLVDEAIAETNNDARLEKVRKALEFFYQDAPVIFLHQQWLLTGVHDRVKNFTSFPDGRVYVANVDVEGER